MSNRDAFGRRIAYGRPVLGEQLVADTDQCPDCRADVRLLNLGDGLTVAQIQHDPSCPWLAAHERTTP